MVKPVMKPVVDVVCRSAVPSPVYSSSYLWIATGLEGVVIDGVDVPEDADPPTLLLEDGNASGFGGCNTFTGGYELDGDSISIGPLAGTLMACELQKMAVEGVYLPALEAADAWSIDGDELVLSSGGEETLRFSSS